MYNSIIFFLVDCQQGLNKSFLAPANFRIIFSANNNTSRGLNNENIDFTPPDNAESTDSTTPDNAESTDSTTPDNAESTDIFKAFGPGVYEIHCKANDKKYIGEASNILERLSKHTYRLSKNVGDCPELQSDWKKYGQTQFEAHVLFVGPEWENVETRKQKENEIILSYLPEKVYNVHPNTISPPQKNYRINCNINGRNYSSIGEASRLTGESETIIRNKLINQSPGYQIIGKEVHGYEPIIANGKKYDSINDAVAAGEAIDRFKAYALLKNPKLKDWNYLSPLKASLSNKIKIYLINLAFRTIAFIKKK